MARSSRRSLFLVVFFLLACGFLGILFAQRSGQQSSITGDSEVKDSLKQFTDVYALAEDNYAEPVNADKAIYNGAIPGMLHALDPHSNFFDPKSYALMREDQRGKYYGVGMTVGPRNNKVIVIYPFTGTPAYKAGIHPGDVIIAVDGKSTENMSTTDVADLLKGPKGTTVHISIAREAVEKPMEFTLIRDEIPRYSVDVHFLIKPGVGDKFLKKGQLIVSHHGRASAEKRYVAQHGNGGKDYPVVVLVNRLTASAAEIVSGAIQDHDRGLIVGEVTFGKGLVQTVYPLSENTGLALTTAHYYTPSGRLIQRDYSNISLYDYYYNRDSAESSNTANREVKLTDSGRTVYGGGGIAPDVNVPPLKTNHFQDTMLQHYAFFNFAKRYVVNHHPTKSFEIDDATLQEFRKSLDEANVPYTQADLIDNNDWIRYNIKSEIFVDAFGQDEGMKVRAESDPQVVKGLELLPQAKALADNARKIVAEHNAAPAFNRQ